MKGAAWHGSSIQGYHKISGWFKFGEIYAGGGVFFDLTFSDTLTRNNFYKNYSTAYKKSSRRYNRTIYNPIENKKMDYT